MLNVIMLNAKTVKLLFSSRPTYVGIFVAGRQPRYIIIRI